MVRLCIYLGLSVLSFYLLQGYFLGQNSSDIYLRRKRIHQDLSSRAGRLLTVWIFLTLLLGVLIFYPSFAAAEIRYSSPNIVMSVEDYRDFLKIASDKEVYKSKYEKISEELQVSERNRERDRYLALGIGVCAGYLLAK
jgi:hypothetical protein